MENAKTFPNPLENYLCVLLISFKNSINDIVIFFQNLECLATTEFAQISQKRNAFSFVLIIEWIGLTCPSDELTE